MVALASSGVRLMPSMPSTMAPATTNTKKRQTLATNARHGGDPGAGPGRARAVPRPGWRRGRGGGGSPWRRSGRRERHQDDDQDAQRPHDQVRHRRRGVRADPELDQEVVEPATALVDLRGWCSDVRSPSPPGQERRQGGVRSRPVFCPRIRLMTTLARTHVAARRNVAPVRLHPGRRHARWCPSSAWSWSTRPPAALLLAQGDDPKTFLKKQGLFVVLGVITMVVVAADRLPAARTGGQHPLLADRAGPAGRVRRSGAAPRAPRAGSAWALAAPALRVRRPGPDPGRGVVLRAPRRRRAGLARRLPPADHGRASRSSWCCCSPTSGRR